MPNDSIRVSAVFPASPERLYEAWLDGEQHGEMTGSEATGEPVVGAEHSAWDGYIGGTNLELEPGRRIVQSWRATDFPGDAGPSRVEVLFDEDDDGTRVTIVHTEIPAGMGKGYELGWQDYYFAPMQNFFADEANVGRRAKPAKAAPKKAPAKTAQRATAAAKKPPTKKAPVKSAAAQPATKKAATKKTATKKLAAKKAPQRARKA
jgi:uncharacterized protein YndB with AHSA1/START domain